ncbi:MAG: DUF2934 domain-containing protein [Steroidobacteraceae bacterium]|jgi:hypothetical protein|nr:DUF2934 domain-containing protein [Steroidobacteraceae bacterium]
MTNLPRSRRVQPDPMPDETIPGAEGAWGDDERLAMIAETAYYRAERRGFVPGYDVEDWLAAEREVDAQLARDR